MTNMYGLWDKFALALKRFGIHTYTTTRTQPHAHAYLGKYDKPLKNFTFSCTFSNF